MHCGFRRQLRSLSLYGPMIKEGGVMPSGGVAGRGEVIAPVRFLQKNDLKMIVR